MNWDEAHLLGDLEAQEERRMTDDLVKRLREGDHFEKVMSAEQAADRIEELEAKLAKAVRALYEIAGKKDFADDPWSIARTTLAELTGGDDD